MTVVVLRQSAPLTIFLLLALMACGETDASVIVEAHVQPDSDCKLDEKSGVLTQGTYDILMAGASTRGGVPKGDDWSLNVCSNGYDLNLRVTNLDDDSVVFDTATVTLKSHDDLTIDFDRKGAELANPFDTRTAAPVAASSTGIVTVQVIPWRYGAQLESFRNEEILVRVVLSGTTGSGGIATSRPIVFPVQLCMGCMYRCLENDLIESGMDPFDAYGEACADNAGADDRVCIDPDC